MTEPVVQTLADVWDSLAQLCADFTPQDWQRPTECPGWSVQDQLAHVVGTETVLMGTPAPEHQLAGPAPHVRNPMGEHNELLVDYRRARAGDEVLAEFRAVTTQRLAELRSLPDEAFDADSWTPIGPGTLRDLVAVRAFDAWVHEQDIRRAVGRPGGLDGAGARHALSRCLSAMPFVVGKKAGAADGQSVLFDIDGEQLAIRVDGGRAKVVPAGELKGDGAPTVRLRMGLEAFTRLSCGRWEPQHPAAAVEVSGDEALGRRVLDQLNFMI